MQLVPFDQLPALETEPFSDWTLLSHRSAEQQSLVLVYAARRDYLSVPKTFIVAEFFGDETSPLEIHQMPRDNYLDEINIPAEQHSNGLFQLEATENPDIALLIDGTTALEIVFVSFIEHQEVYYSCDSQSALGAYLKQPSLIR